MRNLVLLALLTSAIDAATLRGVIVEHLTGRPLARAQVVVQPLPGSAGSARTVRANQFGIFEFPPLPAGSYLVNASRPGFVTLRYGQKDWHASGLPVVLEADGNAFLNIRLRRYGAIGGTVFDENDVGMPEVSVVAYRNTRPPQLIGNVVTDDRGMYRIPGLEPGEYLVRTTAKVFEDEGYLPTFSRQTARVEEAYAVEVRLDEQADNTNVKPEQGRLLQIGGRVYGGPYADTPPVTVTLISDMGRETVTTSQDFRFNPVAPGPYEIIAETAADRRFGVLGGYMPIAMERDRTDIRLGLNAVQETRFVIEDSGGKRVDEGSAQILVRRKDLAGDGPVRTLRLTRGQSFLGPGRWELTMVPPAEYYVSGFSGPGYEKTARSRPDGWSQIVVGGGYAPVAFTLTAGPGSLHGMVLTPEREPAAGAPVFLEAYDQEERRRVKDVIVTRSDTHGGYRFTGLAPGVYRAMSSFEYQMPDAGEMERAGPQVVKIEAARDSAQELDLYVVR